MKPLRICFVCQGNIIRSPLAEALFRKATAEAGIEEQVALDSAGTSDYHRGEGPDRRMHQVAARKGLIYQHKARPFEPQDFERFDLVIALDRENQADLKAWAANDLHLQKIRLLREFDPIPGQDVPDPYYGGADGFEKVYTIVERSVHGWVQALQNGSWEQS